MDGWWVNQNKTYKHEVHGGFLWSPKANKDRGKNQFYDNMTLVKSGDLIFSFCDTLIKAVGVALGPAETADKPEFGAAGENWEKEGWLVPVEFSEIEAHIRPKDFIERAKTSSFADKYAFSRMGMAIKEFISQAFLTASQVFCSAKLENRLMPLLVLLRRTKRRKMKKSRRRLRDGLTSDRHKNNNSCRLVVVGDFRSNVRLNEKKCRITGVQDVRLLIASHIKPWADSSDKKNSDGCNGLLLSPHVDRLFDQGLISFQNDGTIVCMSSKLDQS